MTFVGHHKKRKAPAKQLTETPLTLPFWAKSIDEVRLSGDWLVIHGTGSSTAPMPSTLAREEGRKDLLSDPELPVAFKARTGDDWKKLSLPHLEFVDAETDEDLVDYVKKYGPVLAWAAKREDGEVLAAQNLVVLRREQRIFAAAFKLREALWKIPEEDKTAFDNAWATYEHAGNRVVEIEGGNAELHLRPREVSATEHETCIRAASQAQWKLFKLAERLRPKFEPIVSAVSTLANLVEQAQQARREELPYDVIRPEVAPEHFPYPSPPDFSAWELLGPQRRHLVSVFKSYVDDQIKRDLLDRVFWGGQRALCALLDDFPPKLYVENGIILELPSSTRFGIRPALYFMLRRYFQMGKALVVCERCRTSFFSESGRKRVRFCGADCSRRQRQSQYYFDTVKKKRRKESKKKRKLQLTSGRKTRGHT